MEGRGWGPIDDQGHFGVQSPAWPHIESSTQVVDSSWVILCVSGEGYPVWFLSFCSVCSWGN